MNKLFRYLKILIKRLVYRHIKSTPAYPYMVEPIQLAQIIIELERLKKIKGNILEIGVFRGMTTRFICEYLNNTKNHNSKFYAIDTFSSFTETDIDYETKYRGKKFSEIDSFNINDFDTWKKNFQIYPFVFPIKSDCSKVDYKKLTPIKLVFLDVDLYLTTKKTLPKIYKLLVPGGIILVDDVKNNTIWDGAYQAYMEFCQEINIKPELIGNNCGIIRKRK